MKKNQSGKLTPAELCMHLDAIQRAMDAPDAYETSSQWESWRIVAMHGCRDGGISSVTAQRQGPFADAGMIVLRFGGYLECVFVYDDRVTLSSSRGFTKLHQELRPHIAALGRHYLGTARQKSRGREEIISPDMP